MPSPSTPPPIEPVDFYRLRDDNTLTFALGERVMRLRRRPTREWLAALADQALNKIMPGMLCLEDAHWFHQQLADPHTAFDVPDAQRIARTVVTTVTSFPWYVSVRLANSAGRSWLLLDAMSLMRGIDLTALPIRRALCVVYASYRDSCKDDDDRAMLDRELWMLPDGEKPQWTPAQQSSSFAAFRAMQASLAR